MKRSAILAFGAALAALSCAQEPSKDEKLAAALAARPSGERARSYKALLPPTPPGTHQLLAVLAGQGAGPIRIGANVAQVQRLMQAPCEVRSENLCRYVSRGMDYHLVGGITQSIHIQRAGRPAGKSATGETVVFGFFPGMIPPDLRLGMLPEAIQQYLGQPKRIERVPGPNPQNTVERHYYPGLVLEYDWWPETEKLILGGILVVKDPLALSALVPHAGAPPADAGASSAAGADGGSAGASARPKAADAGAPRREPEPR
jgi:hypothetical protein